MRSFQVQIDHQDITRFLLKKDLPKEITRSVKRTGFFSWEARPVSFTVIDPDHVLTLARNQSATVYVDAAVKISGYVSKIENGDSDTPKITISPAILKLKEITVGDETSDGDRIFETDGYQTIRQIVNRLLTDVGSRTGLSFPPATEAEIPDECATPRMGLFGLVLRRVKRGPEVLKRLLINLVFGRGSAGNQPGAHFRKKGDTIYYIEEGAGFESRLWLRKGDVLNWSFKKTWKVAGVEFGFDFGTFQVPDHDWKIPTFKAHYHVYRCQAGQLDPVETLSWGPIWPFNDPVPDLTSTYGSKWNGTPSSNITAAMLADFAESEGLVWHDRVVWFDMDELNSYALMYGRRKNEIIADLYLIAFQTPFDNRFKLRYKNAKAIDIMKDLAVAGYRYLTMDNANRIQMPGRDTPSAATTLPPDRALKEKKIVRKPVTSAGVQIRRYSENSRGGVSTWGMVMSLKEEEALQRFYTDLWDQTEEIQTTYQYYFELVSTPPPDLLTARGDEIIVRVAEPLSTEGLLTIQTERLIHV